jgi:hypothetical protein
MQSAGEKLNKNKSPKYFFFFNKKVFEPMMSEIPGSVSH